MTRKAYAEALGVNVVVVKSWEMRGCKPSAGSLAKIYALQKLVGADGQQELLDHEAEKAAARAEAKAAADKARALDKRMDAAMRRCRPLSKKATQRSIFS